MRLFAMNALSAKKFTEDNINKKSAKIYLNLFDEINREIRKSCKKHLFECYVTTPDELSYEHRQRLLDQLTNDGYTVSYSSHTRAITINWAKVGNTNGK